MPRAKRQQPNDLKTVHDRQATDLLRNAQVAPLEVSDPYEAGDKIIVMRSTRGDPLAGLHARQSIDEAQYQGGRAFQFDFETAERGPMAIDPSKEFVDGGMMPEPITEAQQKATKRLGLVHRALGQNGAALTTAVLIDRKTIDQICADRMLTTQRENDYIGKRFRECLTELALIYGFQSR